MQDKEKMKEFEKTKLQFEQLLEFKGKVMESQVSYSSKISSTKLNHFQYIRIIREILLKM